MPDLFFRQFFLVGMLLVFFFARILLSLFSGQILKYVNINNHSNIPRRLPEHLLLQIDVGDDGTTKKGYLLLLVAWLVVVGFVVLVAAAVVAVVVITRKAILVLPVLANNISPHSSFVCFLHSVVPLYNNFLSDCFLGVLMYTERK